MIVNICICACGIFVRMNLSGVWGELMLLRLLCVIATEKLMCSFHHRGDDNHAIKIWSQYIIYNYLLM